MGPGHDSNLTFAILRCTRYTISHFWYGDKSCKKKKKKRLYTQIARYTRSPGCPIYTSIMSPQKYDCSLSKVRTCMHCEFANIYWGLFTSFRIQPSLLAGPDGGSWPMPSRGSEGICHGILSARQQQHSQILSSFLGSRRPMRHMLWEPLTQARSPPFAFVRSNLIKMASVGV